MYAICCTYSIRKWFQSYTVRGNWMRQKKVYLCSKIIWIDQVNFKIKWLNYKNHRINWVIAKSNWYYCLGWYIIKRSPEILVFCTVTTEKVLANIDYSIYTIPRLQKSWYKFNFLLTWWCSTTLCNAWRELADEVFVAKVVKSFYID